MQRQAVLNDWQMPTSDGGGFNREGLLKARKLLLEAGFYYDDMKLYQPDGKLAQIELLMTGDTMGRVLLPYIRNLKRLGLMRHYAKLMGHNIMNVCAVLIMI